MSTKCSYFSRVLSNIVAFLIYFILFIHGSSINGQSDQGITEEQDQMYVRHKSWRFEIGIQALKINSELNSVLNHSGIAIPLQLGLNLWDDKKRQSYRLNFTSFKTNNQFNERELTGMSFTFQYRYHRKLKNVSGNTAALFLGGYIKAKAHIKENKGRFFANAIEEDYASLGPSLHFLKIFNNAHFVDVNASFSLFSYLDDRLSFYSPKEQWVSFADLLDYNFEISYTLKPNNSLSLILNYRFNYVHSNREQVEVRYASNTYSLGFIVQI